MMKKIIIYTVLLIYPTLHVQSQNITSIEKYRAKFLFLETKLLKETGTKSIKELKEKSKYFGPDFKKSINIRVKYNPLIEKYNEELQKLNKEYLDVININNIIFSRLENKFKKDEFETTENYNQRISQFKNLADSIIITSICEYIDAKSIIRVKYLSYNADKQIYNVEMLLGSNSHTMNGTSFDNKAYTYTTKINSKFKISQEEAREMKYNPIEDFYIKTRYENWSDENGLLIPSGTYKINNENTERTTYSIDDVVVKASEYETISLNSPVKDIIFSYQIDSNDGKIIFNFTEYMRNKRTESKE